MNFILLPKTRLHRVGLFILPNMKLLPLEDQVLAANLDPARLWATFAIADADQGVVKLAQVRHARTPPAGLSLLLLLHCVQFKSGRLASPGLGQLTTVYTLVLVTALTALTTTHIQLASTTLPFDCHSFIVCYNCHCFHIQNFATVITDHCHFYSQVV